MIAIPLDHLHQQSPHRPPGYVEDVIRHGTLDGQTLLVPEDAYAELIRKYRQTRPPASAAIYAARVKICEPCVDQVCRRCPNTELDRLAAAGSCPLGFW